MEKNIEKEINECIENFKKKIKKINLKTDIEMKILESIKILENKKTFYLKDISLINKDKDNNIIIKPINLENIKKIENEIKKIEKKVKIEVTKDSIKISKNKIITEEEKNEIIKNIKNEKEISKIIIRKIRREENKKIKNNIKLKNYLQKIVDKANNEIDLISETKIKNIV